MKKPAWAGCAGSDLVDLIPYIAIGHLKGVVTEYNGENRWKMLVQVKSLMACLG